MLRAEQGLSRSELGTLTGISAGHLAEIEDETGQPHPAAFSALARALDTSPDDLASMAARLGRAEERPPSGEQRERSSEREGDPDAAAGSTEADRDAGPPRRRVRSFTMPLMGGEWEATPGSEPPRRKREP